METVFCVDCLQDALQGYGKPEVFNSDQGAQFTGEAFTGALKQADITTAKAGRGRAFDNIFVERLWRSVKHEDVYLHGYSTMGKLLIGLTKYFEFYNNDRPHLALGNQTPDEVYQSGVGGGALIVDKYPRALRSESVSLRATDSERSQETMDQELNKSGQPQQFDIVAPCPSTSQNSARPSSQSSTDRSLHACATSKRRACSNRCRASEQVTGCPSMPQATIRRQVSLPNATAKQ